MNTTITVRRDRVGRYANQNLILRFLFWLVKLPFRFAVAIIHAFYWGLSHTLPSRKTALKVLKYQLFVTGWILAAFLARQQYVVRCSVGGMFMTKEACGEAWQNKFDSSELAREQFLQENQDILK
jgi:hypothetical protein